MDRPRYAALTKAPAPVAAVSEQLSTQMTKDRYQQLALLGQGGMGEVHLCHDGVIGRDVALKRARGGEGGSLNLPVRFLREARVQGQLEHPSIVPVYDLGVGSDGAPFFTMKRVRGITLEQILDARRGAGSGAAGGAAVDVPELAAAYSRRKLLSAFSTVCLAVDFAHQRGVTHRDLKPANIMLGPFGEVYVLDWGLAKIAGDAEPAAGAAAGGPPVLGQTVEGLTLGTPGYMAPEQARGELSVTPQADVYALGAILFEILALSPLHIGETALQLLFSAENGVDGRPSLRQPADPVPPELDDLCKRATAHGLADRLPSARALHEALERYLDGDRDLLRRQALAEAHAEQAHGAMERALDAATAEGQQEEERRRALREAGQALAFAPENRLAQHVIFRLLASPPRSLPEGARESLQRAKIEMLRFSQSWSGRAHLGWLLLMPQVFLMGVRGWWAFLATWPILLLCGGLNLYGARIYGRSRRVDIGLGVTSMLANMVLLMLASRMLGPLLFLPGVAVITSLTFAMHPEVWVRLLGPLTACLAIVLPAALEAMGVLPASYQFRDGALVVLPQMHALPPRWTPLFLLSASLGLVVTSSLFIGRVRQTIMAAERRLHIQSWHLRQLVP